MASDPTKSRARMDAQRYVERWGPDETRRRLAAATNPYAQEVLAALDDLEDRDEGFLSRIYGKAVDAGRALNEAGADVGRQIGKGLGESGVATAIGTLDLVGADETADELRERRDEVRADSEAETLPGAVAGVASRIAGDAAQFLLPGAVVTKAGRAIAAASRGGRLAQRAAAVADPASRAGRVAKDVLSGTPASQAIAAAGPEESTLGGAAEILDSETLREAAENPAIRAAAELGVDVFATGLVEALGAARRGRPAAEPPSPRPDPPRPSADEIQGPEVANPLAAEPATPPAPGPHASRLPRRPHEPRVTVVEGTEIADPATVEFPEFRNRSLAYLREKYQGLRVPNLPSGVKIRISRQGLKEATSAARTIDDLKALAGLPGLLREAVPVATVANRVESEAKHLPWVHVFEAPVRIGDVERVERLLVKEGREGRFFYWGRLEPPNPASGPTGKSPVDALPGPTGSKDKILRGAAADINPDEYVNVEKFNLSDEGQQVLRDEVTRVVQERGWHPKETVSWDEVRKTARELAGDPDLLSREATRLNGAEMLAMRNVVKQNVAQIEDASKRLTDPTLTIPEREALAARVESLEQMNNEILGGFVQARTAAGRDLNNLKILAEQSTDPVAWMTKAKRVLGQHPLTDAHRVEIRKLAEAEDRAGLVRFVESLRKADAWEKGTTLWKAGLLTAPPTHLANLTGNTTMLALDVMKDVVAVPLDRMLGAFTGQTTRAPSIRGAMSASWRGAKKGFREGLDVMRGKRPIELSEKIDLYRETNFDNAFLDVYTKSVFRALDAGDRFFRHITLARSLDEQARVIAKTEGKTGDAAATRIRELLDSPTDEMSLRAIEDAEKVTFRNRGALGSVAQGAKRAARSASPALGAASEVVVPFTMTPANVATRVLEYSPLGALSTVPDIVRLFSKATKGKDVPAIQRKIVNRLGASTVGTAPVAIGYLLAANELMTGNYPDDQRTRAQWQLEGKQENAVLIDGAWRSLNRVSPLGNLVALGGHTYHVLHDPDASPAEKLGAATASVGTTLSEQTFLTGLRDFMNALGDPQRHGPRYAQNLAGSAVPAAVRRVARGTDPKARDVEGPLEAVVRNIPGASRTLPARVDQFGEDIEQEGGLVAAVADPLSSRTDRTEDDPVIAELERVGAGVPFAGKRRGEEPDVYRERVRAEGPILRQLLEQFIGSDEYRQGIRREAELLVERVPEFRGADVDELELEMRRERLEEFVSNARRAITRARQEAEGR